MPLSLAYILLVNSCAS